jgi:anti-anti-sigma factor
VADEANVHLSVAYEGEHVAVIVSGELDVYSRHAFSAQMDALFRERQARIIVDLTSLTFVDSGGIAALLRSVITARERGTALDVVGVNPAVQRVFDISGVTAAIESSPHVVRHREPT